jgi:hypothetical protein
MCRNGGDYGPNFEVIQPVRTKTDDEVNRLLAEYLTAAGKPTTVEEVALVRTDWTDPDDPDLPAPPMPEWWTKGL